MLGYSKIQIMGNIGNVPEMRFLPSGDHVVNFSVAVNRSTRTGRETSKKTRTGIESVRLMESAAPAPNFLAAARRCF